MTKRNQIKKMVTTGSKIKRAASKLGFTKFDVINLGIPPKINESVNKNTLNTAYIPNGADNLFPQFLAEVKRQSPTHRAILGQKKIISMGKGFETESERGRIFIDNVNVGESLREVYGRLLDDYYSFGNAYLQIVRHKGGINLYHIDSTKCRIGKNQEEVFIHPDWSLYQQSRKEMVVVPLYPNFDNNTSIVQFKDYEPTFNYYGLPDFVAALEWCAIDYQLQKYNHTKFENNFMPSCIVEINGDMGEAEAEKLVKDAQQKWLFGRQEHFETVKYFF